jgi:hypothetical protein
MVCVMFNSRATAAFDFPGSDGRAVDLHRARSALADAAPELGSSEAEQVS